MFWGPMGLFTLDEDDRRPLVLIAGGIGMTPFYSMIAYAFKKKLKRRITFLVSFSTRDDFVYYQELMDIVSKTENISVIYTVTQPDKSKAKWEGETGRISEAFIRKHVQYVPESVYYVCGPKSIVDAVEELLEGMHVSEEQIHIERFSGYQEI
jgi:glycine betaine catabolism B